MSDMLIPVIIATCVITVVGIIVGVLLSVASNKFKVEVNELEVKARDILPGNNCGACGYPGCDGLAHALVDGEASANACPVGGDDVANKLSELFGSDGDGVAKQVAFVKCSGDCEVAPNVYNYEGINDCNAAFVAPNHGPKGCSYGCTGLGSCVKACPFDAIQIIENVAVVDKEKCKGCKACIAVCPKSLIEMVPYDSEYKVKCNSKDKGKEVKQVCKVGCIGCGICVRNCEANAISVNNNVASIDYSKCTDCGTCAEKCPVKIITKS